MARVPTGLLGLIGNKGGVAVSFELNEKSFLFVRLLITTATFSSSSSYSSSSTTPTSTTTSTTTTTISSNCSNSINTKFLFLATFITNALTSAHTSPRIKNKYVIVPSAAFISLFHTAPAHVVKRNEDAAQIEQKLSDLLQVMRLSHISRERALHVP